jgi:hypothetical protein
MTLYGMAGSRVLTQEADFAIGINKTLDKKVYIKDVAFRYADDSAEKVAVVRMDEGQWLSLIEYQDEAKLLSAFDGRRDDQNKNAVLQFMEDFTLGNDKVVETRHLQAALVETRIMSKETLHKHLATLKREGKIAKPEIGQYILVS